MPKLLPKQADRRGRAARRRELLATGFDAAALRLAGVDEEVEAERLIEELVIEGELRAA